MAWLIACGCPVIYFFPIFHFYILSPMSQFQVLESVALLITRGFFGKCCLCVSLAILIGGEGGEFGRGCNRTGPAATDKEPPCLPGIRTSGHRNEGMGIYPCPDAKGEIERGRKRGTERGKGENPRRYGRGSAKKFVGWVIADVGGRCESMGPRLSKHFHLEACQPSLPLSVSLCRPTLLSLSLSVCLPS